MEKFGVGLLLILVFAVTLVVSLYSDDEVRLFINRVHEEERLTFIRYAVIRGYELYEGKSSGYEKPDTTVRAQPQMLKSIYHYFLTHHMVGDMINFPSPLDVICFPSGCIEIDDPGIHP